MVATIVILNLLILAAGAAAFAAGYYLGEAMKDDR